MTRLLTLVFAVLLCVAGCADLPTTRRAGHVIIVGVDGMSTDGVAKARTPVMHDLMAHGSWSLHARGVMPTISGANWASVLDGAGPEQHGITDNNWGADDFHFPASVTGSGAFFPSIFQIITDQKPQWQVGSVYEWEGFGGLYDHRFVDYDVHGEDPDKTTDLAADYIRRQKPDFLFVHLDLVDEAGHEFGHGTPKYYEAVARADTLIGRIRQATQDAGIAADTVLLVTADHGGVGKGHGGESLAELEIPWIAYGRGIRQGQRLDLPINTFDTPATAAWLLGVKIPYAWLGRPVKPILEGQPFPEQTYAVSSLFLPPVIQPQKDGGSVPGALFADGKGVFSIENPNTDGEIRYTTDGSVPTAASPLYTAPVTLTRNTRVHALVFKDGRPASTLASGEYRVLAEPAAHGVRYRVYLLPDDPRHLPDFSTLQPAATGVTHEISLTGLTLPREDNVAVVFEAGLDIPAAGTYDFVTGSDDGSRLYIDGRRVVDNDGDHGVIRMSGSVPLTAGRHALRVEWFNGGGGSWLGAWFSGPGLHRQLIDPNLLTLPQ